MEYWGVRFGSNTSLEYSGSDHACGTPPERVGTSTLAPEEK
jgi:hypothetical protein